MLDIDVPKRGPIAQNALKCLGDLLRQERAILQLLATVGRDLVDRERSEEPRRDQRGVQGGVGAHNGQRPPRQCAGIGHVLNVGQSEDSHNLWALVEVGLKSLHSGGVHCTAGNIVNTYS